jgi:hypothetical protein
MQWASGGRATIVCAAVVAVAVGGFAYTRSGGSTHVQHEVLRSESGVVPKLVPGDASPAGARSAFSVFERRQSAAASAAVATIVRRHARGVPAAGLEPGASRLALRGADGFSVYALAGPGTLCVAGFERGGGGGISCASSPAELDQVATGERAILELAKTTAGYRVFGLLADGTRDIDLTLDDGQRERLTLHHNVIESKPAAGRKPDTLTWTAPDGSHRSYSFAWTYKATS